MATIWNGWYWHLGLASLLAVGGAIASGNCVLAQVTPDGTLGAESSVVTPTNVNDLPGNQIDGGATRGANLFHSFDEFSVRNGGEAFFNNSLDIQNIISRVTGGSISNIDGLLRANGTANLFLLNPNGIIFGPNASLNIGGSFVGSTASSLNFADGTQFSATAPQATPLLTVSVPIGLQFGGTAGDIRVQGSRLLLLSGETLALVGGNVTLERDALLQQGPVLGTDAVTDAFWQAQPPLDYNAIRLAQGGQIELGSVAGSSLVSLSPKNQGWSLGYEGVQNFQDIQLAQAVEVGDYNTDIQIAGRRVTLSDTDINSRNLSIRAGQLIAQGTGNFPNMSLEASDNVTLTASDFVELSNTNLSAGGAFGYESTGNIVIDTKRLIVRDMSLVQVSSSARGNNLSEARELQGGNLTVTASESVEVISSFLSASGGVSIVGGRTISGTTSGTAGTTGTTTVEGEAGEADSLPPAPPPPPQIIEEEVFYLSPGNLTITTGKLIVQDGGQLSVSSSGGFLGGNLTINASEFVRVSGKSPEYGSLSGLSATFSPTRVVITVDPSPIISGTNIGYGSGSLEIVDTGFSTGRGGSIVINTPQLSVEDGSTVRVSSTGTGDAGDIEVTARSVLLDDQGQLIAETESGQGGNITLRSQDLLLLRGNSSISSTAGTAQADGNGGNITIDTDLLVPLENSDITANAFEGRGGNIQINTQGLFLSPDSDITASSEFGVQGEVEINNPDVDPTQGLVELPAELVDASNQIAQGCPDAVWRGESKFIITGRGGLPPNPYESLRGDNTLTNWSTLEEPDGENRSSATPATNSTIETAPTTIVEANGWVKGPNGEVTLIATAPTANIDIPWLPESSCNAPEPES